jgi:PAS domain S-box-containing protein
MLTTKTAISMSGELLNFERPIPIDKEVSWDKSQIIMSKTDPYGTIEYCNEAFIDASGYEDYELISKPHNIIRHPDMPSVIFKVLWDNLKKGENYHAIIKNLAKNGRYYWVVTDFEISKDDSGRVSHYIARRRAVANEIITRYIEPLYKRLLQIEQASGMEASEKYLMGFLEEKNKNYVEYIIDIIEEHEMANRPKTEEPVKKGGLFSRLFNK